MTYEHLSADDLERQFNPRTVVVDFQKYLTDYTTRSRTVRRQLAGRLDILYGDGPLQTLDVFPAARRNPPIHVFIHGGYWRALDKSDHSFIAEPLVSAGATTVILNHDLCPDVTLDTIVRQVRAAVAWIYRHADELGGDRDRIFLSGQSAGAHLAVMALFADWIEAENLPNDVVKGVCAVSGIFDLSPVLRISVNEQIRLTREMALRNSPVLDPPKTNASLLVVVGEDETAAWIQQSVEFYEACRSRGIECRLLRLPGQHHYSILGALTDTTATLHRAMIEQMSLA